MTALTKTGQLRDLEGRHKSLLRLVELSVTLNSTLDLDELLQLITATATELLECEAASILLYDEKNPRLYFAAATGSNPAKLAEIPVPIDNSLAGTIFRTNQPLVLNNVQQDPRHYSLVSDHIKFKINSLLGVPNTAFTEAFAFYFQARDLELLGLVGANGDDRAAAAARDLQALEAFKAEDQETVIRLLDAMIIKQRVESALAPVGR